MKEVTENKTGLEDLLDSMKCVLHGLLGAHLNELRLERWVGGLVKHIQYQTKEFVAGPPGSGG